MIKAVNEAFGIDFQIQEDKIKGLQIYMTSGRIFYKVSYGNSFFYLVKLSSKDQYGAAALEKQLEKYKTAANAEIAYHFDTISKVQRNALVSRRIPFISGDKQMYLPFLGIVFHNTNKQKKQLSTIKMMPATQRLFLYLLYLVKDDHVMKKRAAQDLNLTGTSITRASEQLDAMGLIRQEMVGKEFRMTLKYQGLDAYKAAKPYLINPVQKSMYIKRRNDINSWILSGESALGRRTMLNEPLYPCYALYKKYGVAEELNPVDIQWEADEDYAEVELWKYDPSLFSSDGLVDPISLVMSLQNNVDERIEEALEEYMEGYKW